MIDRFHPDYCTLWIVAVAQSIRFAVCTAAEIVPLNDTQFYVSYWRVVVSVHGEKNVRERGCVGVGVCVWASWVPSTFQPLPAVAGNFPQTNNATQGSEVGEGKDCAVFWMYCSLPHLLPLPPNKHLNNNYGHVISGCVFFSQLMDFPTSCNT